MTCNVRRLCMHALAMVLVLMFVGMVSASTVITGTADVTSPTEGAYKKGTFSIAGNLDISITKTQTETAESYYVKAEVFADSGFPIISDQSSITFSKDETGTKTKTWTDMFVVWSTTAADDGSHTANARVSYKPIVGGTWTPVALDTNNFIVDNTPPVTTKTVDPADPDGLNGWYVSVITVSLSATDPGPCPSGVDYTEVNVDGTGWVQSTTVYVGNDGEHTFQYRSVDNVGNVEATHTQYYKLDTTPPIATFTHSVSELTVNFDASGSTDATSGIDRYEWDFGDGSTGSGVSPSHTYSAEGTYTVTLRVWDKAGNDGTGTAKFTVSVSVLPEFPLGVEAATGIGLMVVVVYIWLRKRKTKPTVAKRFTTKTPNLDSC